MCNGTSIFYPKLEKQAIFPYCEQNQCNKKHPHTHKNLYKAETRDR